MNHKFELISFKLCPFVQRSLILLNEKGIDYKVTYIDLANKPEWFLEISPLGKVPLLKVDNTVLFESTVINEFLDELISPSLHPDTLLLKAQQRSWIEFSSELVFDVVGWLKASEQNSFNQAQEKFYGKLKQIESELQLPFFGGSFYLVDIAFAPILMRLAFIKKWHPQLLSDFPKILRWMDQVLSQKSVMQTYNSELEEIFINRFRQQGSYLLCNDIKE